MTFVVEAIGSCADVFWPSIKRPVSCSTSAYPLAEIAWPRTESSMQSAKIIVTFLIKL